MVIPGFTSAVMDIWPWSSSAIISTRRNLAMKKENRRSATDASMTSPLLFRSFVMIPL